MKLSPMVRTALFVADLATSAKFYADVLSLTRVYWEGELEGDSLERLLGANKGTHCINLIEWDPDAEARPELS